jgi:hypothetical protein
LRGDADTAAFEVGQGDLVAFALLPQAVGHRHLHVFEEDLAGVGGVLAEFVLDPRDRVARRIGRHDERADPALAGTGSVTANTITTPAFCPEVMNCLQPLST